ncbi:MAG: peptidoglycan recognition protein family protein [bacterium]|nr:peptidoglycan recognition protein family protein [bacterium]
MWRAVLIYACGVLLTVLGVAIPQPLTMPDHFPENVVHYIVIHHAASGAPDSEDAPRANKSNDGRATIKTPLGLSVDIDVHTIDRMHKARGFDEIGYNYVVRFDGTVERGRAEDIRGAHARAWDSRGISYNASSIGICFAGNCDAARWTEQQQLSGYKLILEMMRRYDVPPERVIGHRECGMNTHCPGELVDMQKVREKLRLQKDEMP